MDQLRRQRWAIVLILLVGAWWRWRLWSRFHFREDEALYAYWAWLIYSGIDPLLATAPVDKPPLFPYLVHEMYRFFGPSEVAARLPNLIASTLSLPLLYGWARTLWGGRSARRAVWVYAALPVAVLMAPTGYTDPLMVGFCLLSAWAASRPRQRAFWVGISGLAMGAALVTKPFAVLWLPLVWWSAARAGWSARLGVLWLAAFAYPLARWWLWETARPGPDVVQLAVAHYGGFRAVAPARWPDRLRQWAAVAADATGGPTWLVMWAVLAAVAVARSSGRHRAAAQVSAAWLGLVLLGYVAGPLEPWDRYLLLVAPVGAALAGAGWAMVESCVRRGRLVALLLAFGLLLVGNRAGNAGYPVGGDHGAYDGVDAVAAHVMATLPRGGILYHRWLGWHYGFYLFGAPYDYRWWSDLSWLVKDACVPDGLPRLIVFPFWAEGERQAAVHALSAAGVQVELVTRIYSPEGSLRFYLYRVRGGTCRRGQVTSQLPDAPARTTSAWALSGHPTLAGSP